MMIVYQALMKILIIMKLKNFLKLNSHRQAKIILTALAVQKMKKRMKNKKLQNREKEFKN